MPIFEGFFGKRKSDPESSGESRQRKEEVRASVVNQKPQEPVLPNREALEREAEELFVLKEKQPEAVPVRATSPTEERTSYTGDAEIKQLSPQEAAMTKARTDVLDMLAKIEKAGLPVSPELRAAVKNELVNLTSEAARIEFQEAERANPINVLEGIYEEISVELKGEANLNNIINALKDSLRQVKKRFLDRFNEKKSELAARQISESDLTPEFIVNELFAQGGIMSLNVFDYTLPYDNVIITPLLSKCGFFPGNIPLPLIDLRNAIQKTGNQAGQGLNPYYIPDGFAGLLSQRNELIGLEAASLPQGQGSARIQLRGGKDFWLRAAKNMSELR